MFSIRSREGKTEKQDWQEEREAPRRSIYSVEQRTWLCSSTVCHMLCVSVTLSSGFGDRFSRSFHDIPSFKEHQQKLKILKIECFFVERLRSVIREGYHPCCPKIQKVSLARREPHGLRHFQ